MSKDFLGEASKCRNKKQEEKRKLNWENWKGNLLILEMGAWKMFPPPSTGEEGGG